MGVLVKVRRLRLSWRVSEGAIARIISLALRICATSSRYTSPVKPRIVLGFAGTLTKAARQNLRQIPFDMAGEAWFLQYSPYVYYNEHCIVFNSEHTPMAINRATFKKLLDFVKLFPCTNGGIAYLKAVKAPLSQVKYLAVGGVNENNANIAASIKHLKDLLAQLENSQIVANLDSFTGTLKDNGQKIDGIVSNVGNITATLEEQQFAQKLAQSVESLNALLVKFNQSEGTVGSLLNDKQLYANLAQASENLSLLLGDLKQNPKRYVHFSLFGSNEEAKAEKKAAKAAKKAQ